MLFRSPVSFDSFLSGKQLLTCQTYGELFPSQAFSAQAGIAIRDVSFLFTDLKGSTALYDQIGDLTAFHLVRQHFEQLSAAIHANRGAVVKTIGDAVMAAFSNPEDAIAAALSMLSRMEEMNRTLSAPLTLKIGLHRGASIAVTLNERIDYFGQTVNIAARIQALAAAGQVCLSESVHDDPGVLAMLEGLSAVSEQAHLRGVGAPLRIHRVTP